MAKLIKITLKRSTIGCTQKQIANVQGLGFKKTSTTVYREDTPEVRGMIQKVIHLLNVEKAESKPEKPAKKKFVELSKQVDKKAEPKKTAKKTTKKKAATKKSETKKAS